MSDHSPFSLEGADLNSLFMPSWAKEGEQQHPFRFTHQNEEKKGGHGRSSFSPRGGKREGRSEGRRPSSFQGSRGRSQENVFHNRRAERSAPAVTVLQGWQLQLLPDARSIDDMAKQVRVEMKAYPLFELTKLILEKPERCQLKLNRVLSAVDKEVPLYQCLLDDTLWTSEKELLAHLLQEHRDRYYRLERTTVEPPKGSYTTIGVCGMSQTLLGPPNHHEYQAKIRQLHAEQFSNLPFDLFKSRIQTVRDEALLEKWKESQCTKEEFYAVEASEGKTVQKFSTLAEMEADFKKKHAPALMKLIEKEVILSEFKVLKKSSSVVQRFVQGVLESLKRFPLPFSHEVGQELASRGLQLFKAHENIVYACFTRPRALNRKEVTVADSLIALLDALEAHRKSPRPEQWTALLASRSLSEGETEEDQEKSLKKDLSWLIHEGYVINYALRGFEVVKNKSL